MHRGFLIYDDSVEEQHAQQISRKIDRIFLHSGAETAEQHAV